MRPPTQNRDYVIPTATSHLVILYRIIDLGTQQGKEYAGETKLQRKIRLDFEVADELHDFGNGEVPLTISKKYTYSYFRGAYLLQDLESWRGKFKPGETDSKNPAGCFDIETMLGKAAFASITHDVHEDGTRAYIESLQPVYQGVEIPNLTRSLLSLILEPDRFDYNVFNSLSPYLQNIISESPEYEEITAGGFKEQNFHEEETKEEKPDLGPAETKPEQTGMHADNVLSENQLTEEAPEKEEIPEN